MKKITLLMLHFKNGGIEIQTSRFANELVKRYQVEIIAVYNINNVRALELDERIKVRYLLNCEPNRQAVIMAIKEKKIFRILKEGIKAIKILYLKRHLLIKAIKELDTDIVFSSRIEFAELLSKYCKSNIIKITQEHQHTNTKKYIKKIKKACKNIDYLALLGQNSVKYYEKWLEGNNKTKIVVVPNMLGEVGEESSRLDNNDVVIVARLDKIKRIDLMLDVIKEVSKKIPDIKLKIVGGGDDEERLKEYASDIGVNENIVFTGMKSNKEALEIVMKSSIFLMTSRTECFPMVLLESFSCGVPVIAFDVPVGPEAIIENGENGILVKDNDKEKMAEEIIKLLENREELNRLGKNAKRDSYKYLADRVMPQWYDLFDKGE